MSKKATRIVVVGGGFGGVKTALNLMNKSGFQVTLISDNTHFEYHGALYRSAVGHSPMEVVIPLKQLFAHATNVELVLDKVGYVDSVKRKVVSEMGEVYEYDKLVLALGNTVNYFNIHGLEENTETMHDISSTVKLRNRLVELFKVELKKPVRIAIVGAGPSGVELAGEIEHFANLIAKRYKQRKPRVKVILVDGSNRVLPMLSEKASSKVAKRLNDLGVEVHLNIQVESCESGTVCMSAGSLNADLILWTAGSKPVKFYEANGTVFTLGRGGRVQVDEYLRAQNQPDIYVLGDNADTKYSGMAQTALHDANFVSRNFIRSRNGEKQKSYRARKPLYVVTVGQKWAVVEDSKGVVTGYRGWLVRRRADLWIFKNFQPYHMAIKTWRQAQKMSQM